MSLMPPQLADGVAVCGTILSDHRHSHTCQQAHCLIDFLKVFCVINCFCGGDGGGGGGGTGFGDSF